MMWTRSTVSRWVPSYRAFLLAGKGVSAAGSVRVLVYCSTSHPSTEPDPLFIQAVKRQDKPSAIFRLRGFFRCQTSLSHTAWKITVSDVSASVNVNPNDVTAVLGFSVEPFSVIQAQLDTLASAMQSRNLNGIYHPRRTLRF